LLGLEQDTVLLYIYEKHLTKNIVVIFKEAME
jgi:hypothetical protein